jgi:2'-5' RNA ligase
MKRLFAAFPVRGELANDFFKIAERNRHVEGVRWTRPDNLHVTLFFIGEVLEENVEKVAAIIQDKFKSIKPFSLEFAAVEVKNKKGKPAMIWARFDKSETFSVLSKQIEEAVKEFMTIDIQHKDPIPHCTLARMKPISDTDLLDLKLERSYLLEVNRVELWMTIQEKDGVRYDSIF